MFWLAYFPIQEAPNIRQKLFGAALGRNRREKVAKHNSNKHNEIYHLGAEIGNRSDFFLQLVIHQKKFCHSPATLSAKSCLVFAIWFLSIAMFTILENSMHLLAWSKALIFVLNCGFTWLTREYTLRHITFSFRCQQCLKSPINSFAPNMNQTVLLFLLITTNVLQRDLSDN